MPIVSPFTVSGIPMALIPHAQGAWLEGSTPITNAQWTKEVPSWAANEYLGASLVTFTATLHQAGVLPTDAGSALVVAGAGGFLVAGIFSRLKDAWMERFGRNDSPNEGREPKGPAVHYRMFVIPEKSERELKAQFDRLRKHARLSRYDTAYKYSRLVSHTYRKSHDDYLASLNAASVLSETFQGRAFLIKALKDRHPLVRAIAAWALGQSPSDLRTVEPLLRVLQRDRGLNGYVRCVALNALERYARRPDVLEALVMVLKTRRSPYDSRRSFGDSATIRYETDCRQIAARILGDVGGAAVQEALIEALFVEKEAVELIWEVIEALGKVGDEGAQKALHEFGKKIDRKSPPGKNRDWLDMDLLDRLEKAHMRIENRLPEEPGRQTPSMRVLWRD